MSCWRDIRLVLGVALPLVCLTSLGLAEPPAAAKNGGVKAPPVKSTFQDFDDREDYPNDDALKTILAPISGKILDRRAHRMLLSQITGLFRLSQPWQANSALRFSFLDPKELQLHLWNGENGITLAYYPGFQNTWAAYATHRTGADPKPEQYTLWALDGGRYRRCGIGTLELHWDRGNLVLTRGDLRLLSVPFARPPAEVYLDGTAYVRGLTLVESAGVPPPPAVRPAVYRCDKPAELDWTVDTTPGCSLSPLEDGRVEFAAQARTPAFQADVPVIKPGLYEFVFVVEDPGPGTGVFLGTSDGRQVCRLAFFQNTHRKAAVFGMLEPWNNEAGRWSDPKTRPTPYAASRQWYRLTVGAGVAKLWTSGDGIQWSQIPWHHQGSTDYTLEGACTQVGLYCLPHPQPRSIKLSLIEVRRLEGLMSLASETLMDQVDGPSLTQVDNLGAWEPLVAKSRPDGVSADEWWRACAVRTLSENPKLPLGQVLLDRLLDASLGEPRDPQREIQLLGEAALLMHRDFDRAAERLSTRYEQLGLALARQGYSAPFTAVSRAMLRSPLWTDQPLQVFPTRLLRHELFLKLGQNRFEEVQGLCEQIRFWNRGGGREADALPWIDELRRAVVKHLVYWAETQAAGRPPKEAGQQAVGPSPWRHPLVVNSSKEGYNLFGEFAAALEGQTYREACQILSSTAQTEGLGLLPDRKDRRLWVSLPVAIELAMRDHSALRQAMEEGFGSLGQLRFKKATSQGDAKGVASITVQFYGTQAARDAHLWLGDRMLAAGRFAEACGHYEQAAGGGSTELRDSLLARQRLAAGLMGRDAGQPPKEAVEIGAARLSSSQFEQLIGQLRGARQGNGPNATSDRDSIPGFAPGFYASRQVATLESPQLGQAWLPDRVRDWMGRETPLDWVSRQTAATIAGGQVFVSNQTDQFAFDLETGRQDWVQRGPAIDRQWPLVRMRPVVTQGRVLVRRLVEVDPELACFRSADGRLLWSVKPDGCVASDPLLLGDKLFVLSVSQEPGERLVLWLTGLDMSSGRVCSRAAVAEFFDMWQHHLPVAAVVVEDKIVAIGGGAAVCCDCLGNVQWIRRQIWTLPPRNDANVAQAWFEQSLEPPVVNAGRVYLMQPGSWCAECVELQTGRLVWRRAVAEATRLAGVTQGRLIAESTDGVTALDVTTGKPAWFHATRSPLETRGCAGGEAVLYLQRMEVEGLNPRYLITWLDPDSGQVLEKAALDTPDDPQPLCGPVITGQDRLLALFASAGNPKKRLILELLPAKAERSGGNGR
jgi:hypothetical protein